MSPALADRFFTTSTTQESWYMTIKHPGNPSQVKRQTLAATWGLPSAAQTPRPHRVRPDHLDCAVITTSPLLNHFPLITQPSTLITSLSIHRLLLLYLPLQLIHCRHQMICWEGISLDWDFDDCPYSWEHHPLTFALQQTGGGKWRLSWVQIRIWRQTTFLATWCSSSLKRQELRTPLWYIPWLQHCHPGCPFMHPHAGPLLNTETPSPAARLPSAAAPTGKQDRQFSLFCYFPKFKKIILQRWPIRLFFSPQYHSEVTENSNSKRYIHSSVHCSTSYKSQNKEAT